MARLATYLAYIFLTALVALAAADEPVRKFHGHKVISVVPQTESQLKMLHQMQEISELDFWKEPSALNRSVDIRVTPGHLKGIRALLKGMGLEPTVMIEDVQALIDSQTSNSTRRSPLAFSYTKYNTFDDILAWLAQTNKDYPTRTELLTIGTSYQGRPIRGLRLTTNSATKTKPAIFLEGGIHAREWIAPATVMYMAGMILSGYGSVSNITTLLNTYDVYIFPVVNPDGYVYTHTTDRMWRKTRDPNSGSSCIGTDPNRNWAFHWGEAGTSTNPCSDTYQGPKAFSAVETKTMGEYVCSQPLIKGFIDFHAYSQMWMSPWGWSNNLPTDYTKQNALSAAAVAALKTWFGKTYTYGTISRTIYPASGSSADYTYGVCGVKYSYGVELRDTGTYGFLLPESQILPSTQETLSAVIAMANYITNNP